MKNLMLSLTLAAASFISFTQAAVSPELAQQQAIVFQLRSAIADAKDDIDVAALITSAAIQLTDPTILNALENTVALAGASNNAILASKVGISVHTAIQSGADDTQIAEIISAAISQNPEAAAEIQAAAEATSVDSGLLTAAILTGLSNTEATAAGPSESDTANPIPSTQNQGPSIPVSSTPGGISPN